jgi:hypothetical protein
MNEIKSFWSVSSESCASSRKLHHIARYYTLLHFIFADWRSERRACRAEGLAKAGSGIRIEDLPTWFGIGGADAAQIE